MRADQQHYGGALRAHEGQESSLTNQVVPFVPGGGGLSAVGALYQQLLHHSVQYLQRCYIYIYTPPKSS